MNSAAEEGSGFFSARTQAEFLHSAEKAVGDLVVRLNSRSFLPLPEAPLAEILDPGLAGEQWVYIQFHSNPTVEERARLAEAGVRVEDFLTGRVWHGRGSFGDLAALRKDPNVRALVRWDPRDRLQQAVFEGRVPDHAREADGSCRFQVIGHAGVLGTGWAEAIASAGMRLEQAPDNALGPCFRLRGPLAGIRAVAAQPFTRWVEFAPPPAVSRDTTLDQASNVNDVRDDTFYRLNGEKMTVAVREVKRILVHEDFKDRITLVDTTGVEDGDHATAVAGQIAGDGKTQPDARGVAPAAKLLGYDIATETSNNFLTTDIQDAKVKGVRVSNHSYGPQGEGDGTYQAISADWDKFLRGNQSLERDDLLVFIASTEFLPAAYKQIDFFAGAKNVVCVSAANDLAHAGDDNPATPKADGIASFSDHGPMKDFRVKPDIVANGTSVRLLFGSNKFQENNGTSFSCPALTGMAALLFQYYKKFSDQEREPSAALAKGLLLNGATDLGLDGPDAVYGFGMANIEAAIETIRQHFDAAQGKRWFEDQFDKEGQTRQFSFRVDTSDQVKVMLVWMDAEGDPKAQKYLVNDLDLELTAPNSSTRLFPYSLVPNSPESPATATEQNDVDNVEQIVVSAPVAGDYSIKVKATKLPKGPQRFAVVLNLKQESFSLTAQSPAGSETKETHYLPEGGGEVTFTTKYTPLTPPYTLQWDFNGDGTVDRTESTDKTTFTTAPFVYPPGAAQYTAGLTLTDSAVPPATRTISKKVEVLARPVAVISVFPTTGDVPLKVFLSATGTTGVIKTYSWYLGGYPSGTLMESASPNFNHTFTKSGTFSFTLVVTDVVGQYSAPVESDPITPEAKSSSAFSQSLNARLLWAGPFDSAVPPEPRSVTLKFTAIAAEYALSRLEASQAIQNKDFLEKEFSVVLDPSGGSLELGPFITDLRGRARTDTGSFKVVFRRRGLIIVQSQDTRIFDLFESLGMTADPNSDSNESYPPKQYELPIQINAGDILFNATAKILWSKGMGPAGKARAP